MNFVVKKTKQKKTSIYKTLYIQKELSDKIETIASNNETSWNNVVISMIEFCLDSKK